MSGAFGHGRRSVIANDVCSFLQEAYALRNARHESRIN